MFYPRGKLSARWNLGLREQPPTTVFRMFPPCGKLWVLSSIIWVTVDVRTSPVRRVGVVGVWKKDVRVLETTVKQHNEDLARLKRELRAGFTTLCDSIEEVKRVVEARRQLMEQQLRRDLRTTYTKLVAQHWPSPTPKINNLDLGVYCTDFTVNLPGILPWSYSDFCTAAMVAVCNRCTIHFCMII